MNAGFVVWNCPEKPDWRLERPNGSGDFVIVLVKTPAYFVLNGEYVTVSAGTLIFYKKGTPQAYGALGCDFLNDAFHFTASDEEIDWIRGLGVPFDTLLKLNNISPLSRLIRDIEVESRSGSRIRHELIDMYIRIFFMKLSEMITAAGDGLDILCGAYYDEVLNLRSEIYNNPTEEWSVVSMAQRLSLSKSYFQHLYKQFFGVSPVADVIRARMERAKYLLAGTAYSVSKVGKMCGYKSDVHFMRQFKAQVGVSPTQYRRGIIINHGGNK